MYPKEKYIAALNGAIDFISNAVDGADEEHQQTEMLSDLSELMEALGKSLYKKRLAYQVKKKLKEKGFKR